MDRQLLLIKQETTYGTDAAAAATDTVMAEAVRLALLGERIKGDFARPGSANVLSHLYGEHAEVSFEIPLAASGAAGTAPKWGTAIKACGWNQTVVASTSVTYAPLFNPLTADSVTIVWRDARRLHKLLGARGRCGLKIQSGQRPMLTFTFRGLHAAVAAGAELAAADAAFTGWNDARPVAQGRTSFAFASQNLGLRELTLDQADNITFRDAPHQQNIQLLGARVWTGKMRATTPPVGTLNLESLWKSQANNVFALVHESGAGNIVTVNGRVQIGQPEYGRDNGEDVADAPIEAVPASLTGTDELAIVLT